MSARTGETKIRWCYPYRVTHGEPIAQPDLGPSSPLAPGGSLLSWLLAAFRRQHRHNSHAEGFLGKGKKWKYPSSPSPRHQSFSSAGANGAKKGTGQHIKHYWFNPTPGSHLPVSASYPSFLWLSSLLLSVCCLWFAPSGCYCFDLLNLCNPEPNPW